MNTLIQNFTVMRGLRLILGVMILIQAILTTDLILGGISAFLIVTALFNIGCCGAGGCSIKFHKQKHKNTIEDVDFEEVVSKK